MRTRYIVGIIAIATIILVAVLYFIQPEIFGSLAIRTPEKYNPLIEKYALQYGLDPCYVKTIIEIESGGNPRAVSSAGARGLGQITVGTGTLIAKRIPGLSYSGPNDLFNEEKNIEMMSWFLAYGMRSYGNNRRNTEVMYNAGGGRVRLADSALPRETKGYLKKTTNTYQLMRNTQGGLCRGPGNGLSGSAPTVSTQSASQDFTDFPELETINTTPDINNLWRSFLGF